MLVKTVEGPAHDIVLGLDRSAFKFDPLALLDEFKDVGPCPDAVGEASSCIPRKTEERDYGGSLRLQLGVLPWLLVDLLGLLFENRSDD